MGAVRDSVPHAIIQAKVRGVIKKERNRILQSYDIMKGEKCDISVKKT